MDFSLKNICKLCKSHTMYAYRIWTKSFFWFQSYSYYKTTQKQTGRQEGRYLVLLKSFSLFLNRIPHICTKFDWNRLTDSKVVANMRCKKTFFCTLKNIFLNFLHHVCVQNLNKIGFTVSKVKVNIRLQ